MKIKTSELTNLQLDYLVAKLEGRTILDDPMGFGKQLPGGYWIWEETPSDKGGILIHKSVYMQIGTTYSPTKHWEQAGPIIERERISTGCPSTGDFWDARDSKTFLSNPVYWRGSSPLIAAMRCFVASKLGDKVEVPEALQRTIAYAPRREK